MLFNSIAYLFFLGFIMIFFYLLPARMRYIWLMIASIGYYLSFVPAFIAVMAVIITLNYILARRLGRLPEDRNRSFFALIVILNLGILAFFKYFHFMFPNLAVEFYKVDFFTVTEPVSSLMMPLGLSYMAFTVLSYQIEVKRKNIEPEKNFGYFSLYLLFFPRVAQGPIERPEKLLPQLKDRVVFDYLMITEGLRQILWGYFKKLVVADRLAIYVNAVYGNHEYHTGLTLLTATVFYSFQIYADFSGYIDIALGSARLFGIKLTDNFRQPYLSVSVKEFWNRWHITFSTWLRDYLFLPIAFALTGKTGKRKYLGIGSDKWIYMIATMLTFAICGIWHGVGWTFLVWGLLFGLYLTAGNWTADTIRNLRKRLRVKKTSRSYILVSIVTTFILVSFAWIFFRADTISSALSIIGKIVTFNGPVFYETASDLLYCLAGITALVTLDLKREFLNEKFSVLYNKRFAIRIAGLVVLTLAILLFGVFDGGQFIYFQF